VTLPLLHGAARRRRARTWSVARGALVSREEGPGTATSASFSQALFARHVRGWEYAASRCEGVRPAREAAPIAGLPDSQARSALIALSTT